MSWLRRHRNRRKCFHHNPTTGHSWIKSQLIELGKSKMYWCEKDLGGCDKVWFK